jgi:hypothetical protein
MTVSRVIMERNIIEEIEGKLIYPLKLYDMPVKVILRGWDRMKEKEFGVNISPKQGNAVIGDTGLVIRVYESDIVDKIEEGEECLTVGELLDIMEDGKRRQHRVMIEIHKGGYYRNMYYEDIFCASKRAKSVNIVITENEDSCVVIEVKDLRVKYFFKGWDHIDMPSEKCIEEMYDDWKEWKETGSQRNICEKVYNVMDKYYLRKLRRINRQAFREFCVKVFHGQHVWTDGTSIYYR